MMDGGEESPKELDPEKGRSLRTVGRRQLETPRCQMGAPQAGSWLSEAGHGRSLESEI